MASVPLEEVLRKGVEWDSVVIDPDACSIGPACLAFADRSCSASESNSPQRQPDGGFVTPFALPCNADAPYVQQDGRRKQRSGRAVTRRCRWQ